MPWRVAEERSSGGVVISVISWGDLFAALQSGKEELFRHELEQLQAMYRELSSDFIAPLASDEDLRQSKSSETNFVKLVDQVTRHLTKRQKRQKRRLAPRSTR